MPSAAIEEPANSTSIDILDINSAAIKKFISDKPYYVLAKYPKGIVKGVDEFETYAWKATGGTSGGRGGWTHHRQGWTSVFR